MPYWTKHRWVFVFLGGVFVLIGLCMLVSPNTMCDGELMSRSDVCPVYTRSHGGTSREFSHYETYDEAMSTKYGIGATFAIGGAALAVAGLVSVMAERQATQPKPRSPRRSSGRGRPGRPRSARRRQQ
ncbi:hypothetical protein HDA40_000463 [Hamadaea flava]|uniref:Uncharacterized protein n=1 Tax=Hamadaea flava TaxID=1742688 RepID=A0ABV8M199_9ACTN|nr:hypothetical protein [Hamadaea flava]MCP2321956.1 hypothetical protein [Hamadaea flava]